MYGRIRGSVIRSWAIQRWVIFYFGSCVWLSLLRLFVRGSVFLDSVFKGSVFRGSIVKCWSFQVQSFEVQSVNPNCIPVRINLSAFTKVYSTVSTYKCMYMLWPSHYTVKKSIGTAIICWDYPFLMMENPISGMGWKNPTIKTNFPVRIDENYFPICLMESFKS